MASYYLINAVTIGSVRILPGKLVDDAFELPSVYTSAGGLLWPSTDSIVAAAALQAQNAHRSRGAQESELAAIMQTAVDQAQNAASSVRKKTVTVTTAMIVALGAVATGTINVGTALPSNARLLGAEVNVTQAVANAGATDDTNLDVGTSGDLQCVIKDADLNTTGRKGDGPAGDATGYVGQFKGGEQILATFKSTVLLNTIAQGTLTIDVFYFELA